MKKLIFTYLFGFLAAIFLLTGCSKEDVLNDEGNRDYYIKFKANGIEKKFEFNAVAALNATEDGSSYASILGAGLNTDAEKNTIALLIGTKQKISSGTRFSLADPLPGGYTSPESILFGYNDEQGVSYIEGGADITALIFNEKSDMVFSFDEVTDKFVKGSFSGSIYTKNEQTSEKLKVVLENGVFYLEREN